MGDRVGMFDASRTIMCRSSRVSQKGLPARAELPEVFFARALAVLFKPHSLLSLQSLLPF